jgi:regulator of protease activity HflC (stomatin/prohibitin superfamily)
MKKYIYGFVGVIVLIILFGSFGTISTGEIGIKTNLSKVVGTVQPGFYVKAPFIQSVVAMDVQIQKEQVDATSASKDLQTVAAKVAINYSVNPDKAQDLYSRIGTGYKSRIIDPAIQEVVKAVTAQYTAEELITKRPEVTEKIQTALAERLLAYDINVASISITNFDFSESFNQAIEKKVTAEQNALAAKNKLAQIKYEAEQTIETAKATAEAQRISSAALSAQGGSDYVQLKAIEKWNGILPAQMIPGSTVPFVNLKN